jgi:hypothetical protein
MNIISKRIVWVVFLLNFLGFPVFGNNKISFYDDFEKGLNKWDLNVAQNIQIIESGQGEHGKVLALISGGEFVRAMIKGSEGWNRYKIEADFLFPDSGHSYMGLIYHYNRSEGRTDFGSIYVKGNGSYIRVNPRRDHNAHRTLYEEYKTPLEGNDAIKIGRWQHFKAEIVDSVCHFYVGDMTIPKVTFDAFEFSSGGVGFKPRVVGDPVWIDNVSVSSISELSYNGSRKPGGILYQPEKLVTDWQVIGPFCGNMLEIEADGYIVDKVYKENGKEYTWQKFATDKRGCVVSGRLTEFIGGKDIAYFHTIIDADSAEVVKLHTSANEALVFWLNGKFLGYDGASRYAWYDFWKNPDHDGVSGTIELKPGKNALMIQVRGGKYAGGGFFVYIGRE